MHTVTKTIGTGPFLTSVLGCIPLYIVALFQSRCSPKQILGWQKLPSTNVSLQPQAKYLLPQSVFHHMSYLGTKTSFTLHPPTSDLPNVCSKSPENLRLFLNRSFVCMQIFASVSHISLLQATRLFRSSLWSAFSSIPVRELTPSLLKI